MRIVRIALLAGALAFATLGFSAAGVAAYGKADQPLAQIAFSANCENPDYPLCLAPPAGFGLGGIWIWVEIDSGGTGDVAGADCLHVRGGPSGGAGRIHGEVAWWWSQLPEGFPAALGAPLDPAGYYNVRLPAGEVLAFPVTQGHYSAHPVPGVAIETNIAP